MQAAIHSAYRPVVGPRFCGIRSVKRPSGGGGGLPPDADMIFDAPLETGVDATTGANKTGNFVRASSKVYYDGTADTDITTIASGNPTFGYAYNDTSTSVPAFWATQAAKNYLLHSEAMNTAPWAAVGTGSVAETVGTLGDIVLSRITASANDDGVEQASGSALAATSLAVYSIFVKSESGSVAGKLSLTNNGGVEDTTAFTATTTGQRVFGAFTGGGSINVGIKITLDVGGTTVLAGGAQIENAKVSATGSGNFYPGSYVKTTVAVAQSVSEGLYYDSSNIANVMDKGTISYWYCPFYEGNTSGTIYRRTFDMNNSKLALSHHHVAVGANRLLLYYNGTAASFSPTPFDTAFKYYFVVATWDNTGATLLRDIIVDGVSLGGDSAVKPANPTVQNLYVGMTSLYGSFPYNISHALISKFRVYDTVKDATWAAAWFANDQADYGR